MHDVWLAVASAAILTIAACTYLLVRDRGKSSPGPDMVPREMRGQAIPPSQPHETSGPGGTGILPVVRGRDSDDMWAEFDDGADLPTALARVAPEPDTGPIPRSDWYAEGLHFIARTVERTERFLADWQAEFARSVQWEDEYRAAYMDAWRAHLPAAGRVRELEAVAA